MELSSTTDQPLSTPSKKPSKNTENLNPNVPHHHHSPFKSPNSKSPALRPSKSNNSNPVARSPQNRIRQRKFVVAKKKNQKGSQNDAVLCKCMHNGGAKCVCVAYQKRRIEEQKRRPTPYIQGLPWTTDEPECLLKPSVKESTRPIDLKLHSDIRAIDRAEFDQQVAEKMNFIEQLKLERERQQKLEEEEEIKRLRKELIPKAQPMPYFDRPFVPRRSMKHPTIPREPKFHMPQHKKVKCLLSWNDMDPYSSYLN
ncbi:protein TPX2 [Cajanus cajan]|nr:protein TPX2 [Cajanus cajan]